MKVLVTMKDPDAMHDAVREAVEREVKQMGLSRDESKLLVEARVDKTIELMVKWFTHGEYMTVEFDTDDMTATVIPG